MQLRQLRYFLAVVEHGSFSAAAAELGRTQQALSKAIHTLEETAGVRLLDRNPRTATPTLFGEMLIAHARNIELELRGFRERVAEMLGANEGNVIVGASATAAGLLVADAIEVLHERQSQIRLSVMTGIYQDLVPALLRGELDICVGVETVDADLQDVVREVLCYEEFRVIAGADHPLAGRAEVGHAELLEHPWILGRKLGAVEEALAASFEDLDLPRPVAAIETNSTEFLRSMLLKGRHLCVLPADLFAAERQHGTLVALNTRHFKWSASISLYYRRGNAPGAAAVAVIDALHAAARRYEHARDTSMHPQDGPARSAG
jgi:DNA-binding transcriptional LysR family regulator